MSSQLSQRMAPAIFWRQTCLVSLSGSLLILALCLTTASAQVAREPIITPGLPGDKETYLTQRRQLTQIDADSRFDATTRLSAAERRAEACLAALRTQLIKKYREQKRFPPSERFHAVKNEIGKTQLYQMLRDMPKGGVLHLHTSSTAPASWIVEKGIREPGCHVCWPDDRGDAIRGQLGFFQTGKAPPGYQPVPTVLEREPDFPSKLLSLLTINASDDALTNLDIWTKFNQIFQRVDGLTGYQPLFEKYYAAAFETLLADQVSYVELRAGFDSLYDLSGKKWDYRDRAQLMWNLRNRFREANPAFDLKLIYSGGRWVSDKKLWPQLEQAVELHKLWQKRNFVVGFDIVGEEDAGHSTEYFLPDWIKLGTYLREQKTTLPLFFHDGESDWPTDRNLYDAYLLGTRRIGHGFNLFRFPALEKRLIVAKVAVEVCPISNQQLRYVGDLRIHPASGYLNRGVPCVLGNDDPGIFGNDGLTYDYWEAVVAWNLDLQAVKQLALNSLMYSAMTEAEKRVTIELWQKSWDRWIAHHAD